jgi:hypothetical protein
MVAIRTGPESGVWVLDVDVPDGHASLGLLESEHGELPPTLSALSPSGGEHFYFLWVDGIKNTAGKLGPDLDTRGQNGYIIAPPSIRADKLLPNHTGDWPATLTSGPRLMARHTLARLRSRRRRASNQQEPRS